MLVACATGPARSPAPVVDRTRPGAVPAAKPATPSGVAKSMPADARGKSYTVKAGDTLYSIALDNGLDYREVAAWNQLPDPNLIKIGQVLQLTEPGSAAVAAEAVASAEPSGVVVKPLRPEGDAPAAGPAKPEAAPTTATSAASPAAVATVGYPKALKLSYSSDAATVARQAEGPLQPAAQARTESRPEAKAEGKSEAKTDTKPEAKPVDSKPAADPKPAAATTAEEEIAWGWPAVGKVITPFSDMGKGIDIGGKTGQPVLAAGAGRVVYAGGGLRGYGKLVIIKHNKTYLSAYAHNSQLLVKEGDNVKKGDKIAEMGNSDAEQVKLHFEIRRFGKPVDPSKYLTAG
ncbi:peptidoglycan DD-metalloendopeptidase family protein [Chitinimonas koreensis]|nr:peptidoglycan DD-metalloendopeptidase family protein [Chitinimonas koreensis]